MNAVDQPVVFAMDGATKLALGIESSIASEWIPGFKLARKDEWRRHDREAFALANESVRGKHAFIISSFASDDMRGVFSRQPGVRFPVKVRDSSGPFEGVPINSRGFAEWTNDSPPAMIAHLDDYPKHVFCGPVDCFLHVLGETVDEKIWGTILFAHSLRDASVADITLIGTMLPYMRQDEKFLPRMLLGPAAFAIQMKAAGINRVITMDVHSKGGMQNACSGAGIRFDHLEARVPLAAEAIKGIPSGSRVLVLAPDIGSSKRSAPKFQETVAQLLTNEWGYDVEVGFAIARKVRTGDTKTVVTNIIEDPLFPIGPVSEKHRTCDEDAKGAYVLCQDDILATGGTIGEVEEAVVHRGGIFHAACYTNGLFTGNAAENLRKVNRLVGTMTVEPWRVRGTPVESKIKIVDLSDVFAEAIKQTFTRGSINALLTGLEPK